MLLHSEHITAPTFSRESRIRMRMAAFMALIAAVMMMIGFTVPASAAEADAGASVGISAERVDTGSYRLKVTNTGSKTARLMEGTTSVPADLSADGAADNLEWQVGELKSGESAYAQHDGKDLVVKVKANAGGEQIKDNTTVKPGSEAGAAAGAKNTTKNASTKQNASAKQGLGSTGSSVLAVALIAAGLVCCGVSFKWNNGRLIARRTVAVVGAAAMVAGCISMVPQQASAAQRKSNVKGVVSALTVNGKEYRLTSDVTVYNDDDVVLSSVQYAKAMGAGWNLGNSFDGVDTDLSQPDKGEEAWGNPKVTRELIHAVKEKGYTSIRIPMTVYHRSTENKDAKDGEYRYVINKDWLKRYKQVVDWAVDEGLYVMINVHHDSWIWLKNWNGDTNAAEYREFSDYWKQIAAYFADEPLSVCFETINEPQFTDIDAQAQQAKLNAVSKDAHDIIRATAGNENRMIVIPTLGAAPDNKEDKLDRLQSTVDFIQKDLKNDPNTIATVHYYSEWVYSSNLGKTGFDEPLWDGNDTYTPRVSIDEFAQRMNKYFTSNGIGVVIGEYGLLAYDSSSDGALQAGEELKYYEYMGQMANANGFSYMFWDNGSGIDRTTYQWKKPLVGKMLEASIKGRSSYATGLDTVYLKGEPDTDVQVPLTLNGNTFTGIDGLAEGADYTYDAAKATVTLKKAYLAKQYQAKGGYGIAADLTFRFSSGADWHEYVVRSGTPTVSASTAVTGSKSKGLSIPVSYNGVELKSVAAYEGEKHVGPNSGWWKYLQNSGSFSVHYDSADRASGTLTMLPAFFSDATVEDGDVTLDITFQDGQTLKTTFTIAGDEVTLK